MEIIKQTYLAANIKEELRELKRNKQHNANLRTQILVHDSFNIVETTRKRGEEVQLVPNPVQLLCDPKAEAVKTHPQLQKVSQSVI